MTEEQLIRRVAESYSDSLLDYYKHPQGYEGDPLVMLIVNELTVNYHPYESDEAQLESAVASLNHVILTLREIIRALEH